METDRSEKPPLDLIWGASDIGKAIGRTRRSTFHMLENGELPAARKVSGRWVIERNKLVEFFTGEAA